MTSVQSNSNKVAGEWWQDNYTPQHPNIRDHLLCSCSGVGGYGGGEPGLWAGPRGVVMLGLRDVEVKCMFRFFLGVVVTIKEGIPWHSLAAC